MSMPFFLPFPLPGDEASLRQAMARPGGLAQVPTGELAHIGRAVAGLDLLTLVRLAEEATQGDGPLLYEFWLGVHGGEPSACAAWFNLGVARMKAGDPAGAAEAYRAALRLKPDMAEAAINMGRSCICVDVDGIYLLLSLNSFLESVSTEHTANQGDL